MHYGRGDQRYDGGQSFHQDDLMNRAEFSVSKNDVQE
jgi:hypothetical protein